MWKGDSRDDDPVCIGVAARKLHAVPLVGGVNCKETRHRDDEKQ